MRFVFRYALFLAVVGCSSSSSSAASSPGTTDAGGGSTGATTQITGTANGQTWTGVSAKIISLSGGTDQRISISTDDACTHTGGNTLEVLPPNPVAVGSYSPLNPNGTSPSATFDYAVTGSNSVTEVGGTGSFTITAASKTEIDGTVDITIPDGNGTKGGEFTGTFAATVCAN
jgi:hypothetical protein